MRISCKMVLSMISEYTYLHYHFHVYRDLLKLYSRIYNAIGNIYNIKKYVKKLVLITVKTIVLKSCLTM